MLPKPKLAQNSTCNIAKAVETRVKDRRVIRRMCADSEIWISVSDNASQSKRQQAPVKIGAKVASKPRRSRESGKEKTVAKKDGDSKFKIKSVSSLVRKHTRK